jgi:hypothetical protein
VNVERLGLIVNPRAGRGAAHNLAHARTAVAALGPTTVVTGPGALGADAVPGAVVLSGGERGDGRDITMTLACDAVEYGIDALVVVGGDGTFSDVAVAFDRAGLRCPIVGIGAGSTNVGALVTCVGTAAANLATDRLTVEAVDGLELRATGVTSLAFNDVVVAMTIVGTLDDAFVNLDADAFYHGAKVRATPRPLACAEARVAKRHGERETLVAEGAEIGCVVVGFTACEGMYGKALVGGIALSSSVGVPAGCIVASFPLVFAELEREQHRLMEPLRSRYVGLDEGETLELRGFSGGAYVCADGNPLKALTPMDVVEVRVRLGVVDVARIQGGPG